MRIIYILLILIPSALLSQSINLYNINTDKFPLVEAEFFVSDKDGNQIIDIDQDQISIKEQQQERAIKEISCTADTLKKNISTILTLDLSSSMRGPKFNWIKDASREWITQMDTTKEETAITTFDDEALLYSDFNIDRQELLDIIQTLELRNGTNFKPAFLDPNAGALDIARRADYQPIVIFLTDGVGTTDFDIAEVVSTAKSMNAIVYAISLEITLPNEIKKVTDATGGLYFEEIDNRQKLIEVYNTIRKIAVSTSPCKISWFTEGCLLGKESTIEYLPEEIIKTFSFDAPGFEPPQFEFLNDEFIEFECNTPGDYILRLRAKNSDIEITSIDKINGVNACSQFEAKVLNNTLPFILEKDSLLEISISYSGTTAEYNFCEFSINSSTCLNVNFYTVSNCLNSPPNNILLKIIEPNGGEVIKSGSEHYIFWSGADKKKFKVIEYSTNAGVSWKFINQGKFENSVSWSTPNITSDKCLVRVQQISEESGTRIYSLNVDSSDVKKVSWNNAGNVFAILSANGKIYLVNSVIGQIANEFDLGNNGEGDLNFLPDGVRLLYSSTNGTKLINLITQQITDISPIGGEIELSFDSEIGIIHNENTVAILNLNSLNIVNQFDSPASNTKITDASISKTSEYIVVSTETRNVSDSIYILDKTDTWENFKTISMIDTIFKFSYQFVEWSHDEKYIISISTIGNLKWLELWDVEKGEKIEKLLNPTTSEIMDISASYYDNYVVMIDRGANIVVWEWDEANQDIFHKKFEFKSESIISNDIEWSKDGSRFAVGQTGTKSDKLVSVYSVKPYPEVIDISDSTFSLVKDLISINDIDMGDVLISFSKDSVLNNIIEYNYNFNFEIDSLAIIGVDRNSFSLYNSPNLPATISDTQQPEFVIEFRPNKEGSHSAKVVAYTKYGDAEFGISGNGVRPVLGLSNISFGEVNVDSEKILTEPSIVNNGDYNLKIHKLEIISPSKEQFQLYFQSNKVDEITDIELSKGEIYNLSVSFLPVRNIISNSRVMVIYDNEFSIRDTAYIKLDGRGIKPELYYYDYNFGIVKCNESIRDSVTLYNKGSGKLIIKSFDVSGPNFKLDNNIVLPITIEEGDSVRIGIDFIAEDNGIIKDSVFIISNSYEEPLKIMYLNGRKLLTDYEVIGNTSLLGIDNNSTNNESIKIVNNGRTSLTWNTPIISISGEIIINSVTPNPTLPGDTSIVSITINSGDKGEVYSLSFAPLPICADSIDLVAEVKNSEPTLSYNYEKDFKLVCEDTLLIKIPIFNIGEDILTIDSIKIVENNNMFKLKDDSFKLNASQNDTIFLTFNNSIPDTYSTDLLVYSNDSKSNNGVTSLPFNIIKEKSDFSMLESEVTFNYLNNNSPGSKTVSIVNTGTIPIRWNIIVDSDFTKLSVKPSEALPGDTSIVTLIYNGNKEIFLTDEFVVLDSCGKQEQIPINILGNGSEFIDIVVSNQRRKIGERFDLTLNISSTANFENDEVLKGSIIFNRTLMRTVNQFSTSNNSQRIVPFEIVNLNEDYLYSIEMEALWGNDSCSVISVSELSMEGSSANIEFTSNDAELCIEDLCYADGVRLLKFNYENENNIQIENNNNTMSIFASSLEESDLELSIYDFYGKLVVQKTISYNSRNKYTDIDISNLATGSYFIQIKSYSQIFNKNIIILK